MGEHLVDGEFQSDKYPETPRGLVPLKCTDKMAQDLLWEYAQRRRSVDPEFSDDLEKALRAKGFEPDEWRNDIDGPPAQRADLVAMTKAALDEARRETLREAADLARRFARFHGGLPQPPGKSIVTAIVENAESVGDALERLAGS